MDKRIYRSPNKMIAGVCAGIAEYYDTDPTIVRLIFVFATLLTGIGLGIIAYIIAWIIIPEKA